MANFLLNIPVRLFLADEVSLKPAALYAFLGILVIATTVFFILHRKSKENEMKKQQLDMELKALRAQMNPHFVFNCLNSIYHCIQMEDPAKAADYLLKFSFLLRRILENSLKRMVPLEEDIDMLKAYLDLEQFRSYDKFTYEVIIDDAIDVQETGTLMLVAQPFVENSIWHGFRKDQTDCRVIIHYRIENDSLFVTIRDNGTTQIDEASKATSAAKRLSLGTALIKDQLNAWSELEKGRADVVTEDVFDENSRRIGREVRIYLPLRKLD